MCIALLHRPSPADYGHVLFSSRDAFKHLQSSRDPGVVREVMAMLPGLARELGEAITVAELCPVLMSLSHQHLSWVAPALVGRCGEFLEVLPVSHQGTIFRVRSTMFKVMIKCSCLLGYKQDRDRNRK